MIRRIKDIYIDNIVYIDSQDGAIHRFGTGFLLGIPIKEDKKKYRVFIVTCKHLLENKHITVTVNTKDGLDKRIKTSIGEWITDPVKDIAIFYLRYDPEIKDHFIKYDFDAFHDDMIERLGIGIGDTAYVIGRHTGQQGVFKDKPICIEGIISSIPDEPLFNKFLNHSNHGYILQLDVKEGFSGSPVFVQYQGRYEKHESMISGPWDGDRLIGIVWGGLNEKLPVEDNANNKVPHLQVPIPSRLAGVEPIESIINLINQNTK